MHRLRRPVALMLTVEPPQEKLLKRTAPAVARGETMLMCDASETLAR
jgi:hypothetical protein